MNTHNHSQECSGVHIGAHCLPKNDLRGAIVSLTSRMLDNPDKSGIYSTTKFYDDLEQFIRSSFTEYKSELAAKVRGMKWRVREPGDSADTATEIGTGALRYIGSGAKHTAEIHNATIDQVLKILEL